MSLSAKSPSTRLVNFNISISFFPNDKPPNALSINLLNLPSTCLAFRGNLPKPLQVLITSRSSSFVGSLSSFTVSRNVFLASTIACCSLSKEFFCW